MLNGFKASKHVSIIKIVKRGHKKQQFFRGWFSVVEFGAMLSGHQVTWATCWLDNSKRWLQKKTNSIFSHIVQYRRSIRQPQLAVRLQLA